MSPPSRRLFSRYFRLSWIAAGLSATAAVGACSSAPDFYLVLHTDDAHPSSDAGVGEGNPGGSGGSGSAAGGTDAAGQGASAGEAGGADSGVGGAAGGEPCENEAIRCRQGVLEQRCGHQWTTIEDCGITGICNAFQNACVPRCINDHDCAKRDLPWAESFCRGDGRCSSRAFETIWAIPSSDHTLQLPFFDDDSQTAKCDFTVSWGDDSDVQEVTDCEADSLEHTYREQGLYRVKIVGTYIGWGQKKNDFRRCSRFALHQLREVVSFGPVGLTEGAFYCTSNVQFPADDVPDSSLWNNARNTFRRASGISPAIRAWDTSNVTRMRKMFFDAQDFNVPLAKWDISQVRTMEEAFRHAAAFDQDLSPWSLVPDVNLKNVFKHTSLSQANYCAIASLPVWREKLSSLGVKYSCPP